MGKIGVSIYPSKSELEEDKIYLKKASELGFVRVFMSLLEIERDSESTINKFKEIIAYGNRLGMETTLDINPSLFESLDVSYDELGFFKDMGAHAIRLDLGFTGQEEAMMTRNPYQLKIELNMSSGTKYIDNIMSYHPNKNNLIASHNFYPMEYSGLSQDHFIKTTEQFNRYYLNTAAFVTAADANMGPWPVQSGLCSLEEHRNKTIHDQVVHYKLMDNIEDLIIGNAYASDKELKEMSEAYFEVFAAIPIKLEENLSSIERKILLDETHLYRGDRSDYLLRSSQTRVKYAEESFEPRPCDQMSRGDVAIGNDHFGQYKGETQIVLKEIQNKENRNLVAKIKAESLFLLDYIEPWSAFKFTI